MFSDFQINAFDHKKSIPELKVFQRAHLNVNHSKIVEKPMQEFFELTMFVFLVTSTGSTKLGNKDCFCIL